MSQRIVRTMTCDRCGHEQEITHNQDYEWGVIRVQQQNGPISIGDKTCSPDLCPQCMKEIHAWWKAGVNAKTSQGVVT
jgi:hypothetical protein